jgi:hypothetical protein
LALGIPARLPGGAQNHESMMTGWWRDLFEVLVVLLSALVAVVASCTEARARTLP